MACLKFFSLNRSRTSMTTFRLGSLVMASLVIASLGCKPRVSGSDVQTFDVRTGNEWIVIGALDPNGTVLIRFCTRDDIAALAASGTQDTRLLLSRCQRSEGYPDIPVKSYEMLFGAQFGVEDMAGLQSKMNVAMVLEQNYTKMRAAALEAGDGAAVKNYDEQISEKKQAISQMAAQLDKNQKKLNYVASVMKGILPVTTTPEVEGAAPKYEESYRLISDQTPGFTQESRLLDELRVPFRTYYGADLDPAIMARITSHMQSKDEADQVGKLLRELGGVGKLQGMVGGLNPDPKGPTGKPYETLSFWEAQRHCRSKNLALPTVRSVGALSAHSRIMTGADALQKDDFVWVSDSSTAPDMAPTFVKDISQSHSVDQWLANLSAQLKFEGTTSVGSVAAFSPLTGQKQTFAMELSRMNEAKAKTLCVREATPAWLDENQIQICAAAVKTLNGNTIVGTGVVFVGRGEEAVKAAAMQKCDTLPKWQKSTCRSSCKNVLSK